MQSYRSVQTAPNAGGAYDIVGDVHGMADELFHLMRTAGWVIDGFDAYGSAPIVARHPAGRHLVFVGDLVNKGPDSDLVLRLLLGMQRIGTASAVMGNHDWFLHQALSGAKITDAKPLRRTLDAIDCLPWPLAMRAKDALGRLPHQLRLPMPQGLALSGDGYVTVVHAAAKLKDIDNNSLSAYRRAIFGQSALGEKKADRQREDWALKHRNKTARWIVHGHTPSAAVARRGRVIGIDTGACSGGALSMLRADTGVVVAIAAGMAPAAAPHAPGFQPLRGAA